uniref:GCS light chain n=1 Tax=Timema monikensis TaxID=170555 RepID=A0A7R9HPV9_9NEOP|nr:unnamed protein product [Timema monikensis]
MLADYFQLQNRHVVTPLSCWQLPNLVRQQVTYTGHLESRQLNLACSQNTYTGHLAVPKLGMAETIVAADTLLSASIVLPNLAGNSLPGPSQEHNVDKRQKRTTSDIQSDNIMALTEIPLNNTAKIQIKMEPHRFLNVCKGVVTCYDCDCVTIEEICEELAPSLQKGSYGGVAILAHSNVNLESINIVSNLQVIAVRVSLPMEIRRTEGSPMSQLENEDRSGLKVSVKVFISSLKKEALRESLNSMFSTLDMEYIDSLVLAYPSKSEPTLLLAALKELWQILEDYVERKKLHSIGVSDVDTEVFIALYDWAKILPRSALTAVFGSEEVTLFWALRFQVHLKCRGVLASKGYVLCVHRSQ